MLKISGLVKTYVSKKNVRCRAVDGVSIDFGEKGLVFIVGKSGSGKSTLLNLLAGLDTAEEGVIEIAGRSSERFSPSDFDAYRNTYVGFVFRIFLSLKT